MSDAVGAFAVLGALVTGLVFGCFLGREVTVDEAQQRPLKVQCGLAHYDTKTGEFVEDKK